jgi:hypothetical protein
MKEYQNAAQLMSRRNAIGKGFAGLAGILIGGSGCATQRILASGHSIKQFEEVIKSFGVTPILIKRNGNDSRKVVLVGEVHNSHDSQEERFVEQLRRKLPLDFIFLEGMYSDSCDLVPSMSFQRRIAKQIAASGGHSYFSEAVAKRTVERHNFFAERLAVRGLEDRETYEAVAILHDMWGICLWAGREYNFALSKARDAQISARRYDLNGDVEQAKRKNQEADTLSTEAEADYRRSIEAAKLLFGQIGKMKTNHSVEEYLAAFKEGRKKHPEVFNEYDQRECNTRSDIFSGNISRALHRGQTGIAIVGLAHVYLEDLNWEEKDNLRTMLPTLDKAGISYIVVRASDLK